ncbi:MAG: type II secretion system protein [Roseateles sp.]|uniref:type II secretion system protein n=1 Tax=Roseateles sp. TaxID=1971397 RepID=UPI00403615BC
MKSHGRGFGLLEAIVALVILASAGLALFAWIGQSLGDVRRIEDAQARAALQLKAVGLVTNINPFVEPKGERRVGAVRIRWTSELIEPMRYSLPFAGSKSPIWEVGLYRLDVVGTEESTATRVEFSIEQPGLNALAVQPRRREDMP